MTQVKTKIYEPNQQAVYWKYDDTVVDPPPPVKYIWREGNYVFKQNPKEFGFEWFAKLSMINKWWPYQTIDHMPLGLIHASESGYVLNYYPDGDLHGNRPFEMDGSNQLIRADLNLHHYYQIKTIFKNAVGVGKKIGFTFGDITAGNLMKDKNKIDLIDLDRIVSWPLPKSSELVWKNTLNIIFGEGFTYESLL